MMSLPLQSDILNEKRPNTGKGCGQLARTYRSTDLVAQTDASYGRSLHSGWHVGDFGPPKDSITHSPASRRSAPLGPNDAINAKRRPGSPLETAQATNGRIY